jgi:hypothetical protein
MSNYATGYVTSTVPLRYAYWFGTVTVVPSPRSSPMMAGPPRPGGGGAGDGLGAGELAASELAAGAAGRE